MNLGSLGLGTSNIASLGRSLSYIEATMLFRFASDLGVRLIDTSDTYGSGDSERLIAKAISNEMKNEFFIITKAGFPYSSLPAWASPLNQITKKIIQKSGQTKNFSGDYLEKSLHRSLKRLKRSSVSAFILHEPLNTDNVSDDTWRALENIKKKGMAEFTGISSSDFNIIQQGIASKQVDIVETPISFKVKNYREILSLCNQENIKVVANQIFLPLKYLNEDKINKINLISQEYGYLNIPIRNILISYVQSLEGVSSILFGTTKLSHLEDNVKAANKVYDKNFFSKVENVFNS